METLIRHYTGHSTFDKVNLTRLTDSLLSEQISSTTPMLVDAQNDFLDREPSNEDEYHIIDPTFSTTAGKVNHFSLDFSDCPTHVDIYSLYWPALS